MDIGDCRVASTTEKTQNDRPWQIRVKNELAVTQQCLWTSDFCN